MGVPKFFAWLAKTQPYSRAVHYTRNDKKFERPNVLALDLNAIIHPIVRKVMSENREQLFSIIDGKSVVNQTAVHDRLDKVYFEITKKITDSVYYVHPTDTLLVAVDGVAPAAKANQQRKRRYLSDMESQSAALEDPSKIAVFNTNAISPGTDFMFELDARLQKFFESVQSEQNRDARAFPPNITYTSHLVPGEGEHTIADLLRKIDHPRIAVLGSDADLLMIYITHIDRFEDIYVMRESRDDKKPGEPKPPLVDAYISLAELARAIREKIPSKNPVYDFITLLMLNGNDFLPRFPSLEIPPKSLTVLLDSYARFLVEQKSPGICTSTDIDWKEFANFLGYFSVKDEPALLIEWGLNQNPDLKIIKESPMQSRHRKAYVSDSTKKVTYVYDVVGFKKEWYDLAVSSYPPDDPKCYSPTEKDKSFLVSFYLEGINWVWNYYVRGQDLVNPHWYYPYHYSPLPADIFLYIQKHNPIDWKFPTTINIRSGLSPLHQLLMILPRTSIDVVPTPIKPLYNEGSVIFDTLPSTFRIDDTGKMGALGEEKKGKRHYENYQKIALLPFADPRRMKLAVDWLKLPQEVTSKYNPTTPKVYTKVSSYLYGRRKIQPRKPVDDSHRRTTVRETPQSRRSLSSGAPLIAERLSRARQPSPQREMGRPSRARQPSPPRDFGRPSRARQPSPPRDLGRPSRARQPSPPRDLGRPSRARQASPPRDLGRPSVPSRARQPSPPRDLGRPSVPSRARQPSPPRDLGRPSVPSRARQPSPPRDLGKPSRARQLSPGPSRSSATGPPLRSVSPLAEDYEAPSRSQVASSTRSVPTRQKTGKNAYVWLLMKGDSYMPGILISGLSVKNTGTKNSLVCMVTPDVSKDAKEALRTSGIFTSIRIVPYLSKATVPMRTEKQQDMYKDWISESYSKWNSLNLVEYDKILFLDADTVVLRNIDSLFEMKTPAATFSSPWSATYTQGKGFPDPYKNVRHGEIISNDLIRRGLKESNVCIGTTVLLETSKEMYAKVLKEMAKKEPFGYRGCNSGADEQLISSLYFETSENWTMIHQAYNMIPWKTNWIQGKQPFLFHYFNRKLWNGKRGEYLDSEGWWELVDTISPSLKKWFPTSKEPAVKACGWCEKLGLDFKFHTIFDQSGQLSCSTIAEIDRVAVIARDFTSGFGQDLKVIKSTLPAKTVVDEISKKDVSSYQRRKYRLKFLLENIVPEAVTMSGKNYYFPNIEFTKEWDIDNAEDMKLILCKTHQAEKFYRELGFNNVLYTGFTSLVLPGDKQDPNLALHVAGSSYLKGTEYLLEAWIAGDGFLADRKDLRLIIVKTPHMINPEQDRRFFQRWNSLPRERYTSLEGLDIKGERWSNVYLVTEKLGDIDFNLLAKRATFNIAPSVLEGFGHVVNDGRGRKQVTITTNNPPMNELIIDPARLVEGKVRSHLEELHFVKNLDKEVPFIPAMHMSPEDFVKKFRALLSRSDLDKMKEDDYRRFLEESSFFREKMSTL